MLRDPIRYFLESLLVFFFEVTIKRIVVVGIFVASVVEERCKLVVLLMPERIIWMTMALHTRKCSSHQRFPRGIDAIEHGRRTKFFIVRSAFVVCHRIAMK